LPAQVHRIAKSRPRGRLDLDGQEFSALLDYEIDFLTAGSAPVAELRALESGVSPYQQIVQDARGASTMPGSIVAGTKTTVHFAMNRVGPSFC
jgi:hypothetical protein